MRSEAPCWKSPKSDRPTWIRSSAVLLHAGVIESRATISPTPIATPATVSAVRTLPPQEVLEHEPGPGHGAYPLIRLRSNAWSPLATRS